MSIKITITKTGLFLFLGIYHMISYAQDMCNPDDPAGGVTQLTHNTSALGWLGICSALIVIIVQFLKSDFANNYMHNISPIKKRVVIVALGQVSGIILLVTGGLGWVEAIISGLITSGGAVAIFEALRPAINANKGRLH